jgi:Recombination endonuclease VII
VSITLAYNKDPEYQRIRDLIANAKATGSKTYFSGQQCLYGHIDERYTRNRNCVGCMNDKRDRRVRILKLRGLTEKEYADMLLKQNGNCAICKNKLGIGQDANLDHCHKLDKARGVLCRNCNLGLGSFKDNPNFLRSAALYVETFISKFGCEEV